MENENLKVDLLTLGHYDADYNIKINGDNLYLTEWFSSKHNMGFTLNRQLWNKINFQGSSTFCTYDEYNWVCDAFRQ